MKQRRPPIPPTKRPVAAGSGPLADASSGNGARLRAALALHQQGRLDQAEAIYKEILRIQPRHFDAMQLLATIAAQQSRFPDAVELFDQALRINPDHAGSLNNRGNALCALGRADESLENYGRALRIKPDYVDALKNYGNALRELGRLHDAVASYRRALEIQPDHAEAHNNLGGVLRELGNLDDAVEIYRRAVHFQPDHAATHNNLGITLQKLGRVEDAAASYRRALQIQPDYAAAHNNLGNALRGLGQLDDAVASYRRALQFKPEYAEAHSNLGASLKDLGKLDEAVSSYRRALQVQPDFPEAYNNLGVALHDLGQIDDAVASYRRALQIRPEFAEAHSNLGLALRDLGKADEAIASHRRARQIRPELAEVHNNLGIALKDHGQIDEAVASHLRALQIKPDYATAHSNLLFTLNYHPDKPGEEIFAGYREYDQRFGLSLRGTWRAHGNNRDPQRRLKVGYVSPDFRRHSIRHFLEPLLAHHDKAAVEVYAYAELVREDEVTARYQGYADHWILTKGMTDEALAERIRADDIDILVDLAGHTAKNRLLAFARKPAPVSLSWLGFGYTTGLGAVDYLLTDAESAPSGSERLFSERPWHLATPGYAYRPAEGMGEVNALPALKRGYVTFGTLTRAVRINHRTIRAWSSLLKRVTGARLVIDSRNFRSEAMQNALAEKFAAHGIDRARLEIGCHSPPWDVLRGIDIGLDCFPHNSGTTLFETLYLGVPLVTLALPFTHNYFNLYPVA